MSRNCILLEKLPYELLHLVAGGLLCSIPAGTQCLGHVIDGRLDEVVQAQAQLDLRPHLPESQALLRVRVRHGDLWNNERK